MPGSLFLIYALAFARLVVLITMDTITSGPRDRAALALKATGHDMLAYLLLCPWCVSIWLSLPAAPVIYAYGNSPWLLIPALALAFSAVAGVVARAKG